MIKLIYTKDGIHLSDFDIYNYVESFVKSSKLVENSELIFSQSIILDQFRVFVRQGKIDHTNIIAIYNDGDFEYHLEFKKDGNLEAWPLGFCDTYDRLLASLLDFQ